MGCAGLSEPRSCVINKEDLCDGLRVLFFMEGLFYESAVKAIQPPDVYGVVVDGDRGRAGRHQPQPSSCSRSSRSVE